MIFKYLKRRIFFTLILLPVLGSAHHSVDGGYDETRPLDIEGEVINVSWRNPHVRMTVGVQNDGGEIETWSVEMISLSTLRRRGVSKGFMQPGDKIKIHGIASRDSNTGIHARNLMLANSQEVILETAGEPYWPANKGTLGGSMGGRDGDVTAPEKGIFRVWSSPTNVTGASFWRKDYPDGYPLTETAAATKDAFNPKTDSFTTDCEPKGMPTAIEQPYPIRFYQEGENIVLHLEEYDTRRLIRISDYDGQVEPSILGHSKGELLGNTLTVTTDNISWPYFDRFGVPLSMSAELLEVFTVSTNGDRLDYSLTVTDPEVFTQPITLTKYWLYFPEAIVDDYDCESKS